MVLFLVLGQWLIFSSYFQFGMCIGALVRRLVLVLSQFSVQLCGFTRCEIQQQEQLSFILICCDFFCQYQERNLGMQHVHFGPAMDPVSCDTLILQSVPAILVLFACPCFAIYLSQLFLLQMYHVSAIFWLLVTSTIQLPHVTSFLYSHFCIVLTWILEVEIWELS